jgi:signal transduction histidine kinase
LPVIAVILVDVQAGIITTGVSLLVYAVFTFLATPGYLSNWLMVYDNPLTLQFWIEAGTAMAMFLVVTVVLLERFHRLQINTLTAERQTAAELARANVSLEEYSHTLEQKVTERTRELTAANHQLQTYTQELEAQNAELDAFAHTVAHDLKNPLAALVGFSSLLKSRLEKMPVEQVQTNLERIEQNGYKMTNIIDELLLLSSVRKLEDVRTTRIDMQVIVQEALQRVQNLLDQYQATVHLPETWPVAIGYAPWVEEIWINYISNGLKYGGQPPHLELGSDTDTNGMIRFWVRDNGKGLTPEQQAQLFTPFTRLHQKRVEGHGLGLSIVQQITEKLGGQVGVESTLNQGSLFYFTLPAADNSE